MHSRGGLTGRVCMGVCVYHHQERCANPGTLWTWSIWGRKTRGRLPSVDDCEACRPLFGLSEYRSSFWLISSEIGQFCPWMTRDPPNASFVIAICKRQGAVRCLEATTSRRRPYAQASHPEEGGTCPYREKAGPYERALAKDGAGSSRRLALWVCDAKMGGKLGLVWRQNRLLCTKTTLLARARLIPINCRHPFWFLSRRCGI